MGFRRAQIISDCAFMLAIRAVPIERVSHNAIVYTAIENVAAKENLSHIFFESQRNAASMACVFAAMPKHHEQQAEN